MQEVKQPPSNFRYSLLGLLLFMSLCAVLAATWPRDLPALGLGFLLIWTALVLTLIVAWRKTGQVVAGLPDTDAPEVTDHRIAYDLARIGSLGPIGSWLLCYGFIFTAESSNVFLMFAGDFCLLLVLNGISFLAQMFSLMTCCRPRRTPALFVMQVSAFLATPMLWLLMLLALSHT